MKLCTYITLASGLASRQTSFRNLPRRRVPELISPFRPKKVEVLANLQAYDVGSKTSCRLATLVLQAVVHDIDGPLVELRAVLQVPRVVKCAVAWQRHFCRRAAGNRVGPLNLEKVPHLRPNSSLQSTDMRRYPELQWKVPTDITFSSSSRSTGSSAGFGFLGSRSGLRAPLDLPLSNRRMRSHSAASTAAC